MWYAISSAGIVQANETNAEIAFRLDLSTILTDEPGIDSALSVLNKQYLFFRANFPIGNLSFSDNDNENQKEFGGKCQLTLNGVTKEVSFTSDIYSFNNNDEYAVGNNVYPLRIGIFFEFEPEDFNLNKYYKPLVNVIEVEVSNGLINRTNLGGNSIFPK